MRHVREAADRAVRVFQIELTNHCNATCTYCPQPTHQRERGFMAREMFAEVLRVMENREVLLHHFGESLLHRELEDLLVLGRAAGVRLGMSTNGRTLTQEKLDRLAAAGLSWLRIHTDPFNVRAGSFRAPEGLELSEHRLLVKNSAPKKELQSFAGHLEVNASGPGAAGCTYLGGDWRVVLWDGSFARCCNDVEGVNDERLCAGCSGYVFQSPLVWGDYSTGKVST